MSIKQLEMRKKLIFCAFLLLGQVFLSFGQLKVTFKTDKIPAIKELSVKLFLAGDFNNWNPGDKTFELLPDNAGSYRLVKTLSQGIYNFKITRGSWQTVECKIGRAHV